MDEYQQAGWTGMSITLDAELAGRIAAYAHYNGLTLEESVAEILDFPLAVYGPNDLPKTPAEQEKLRKMLRPKPGKKVRLNELAKKLRVTASEDVLTKHPLKRS